TLVERYSSCTGIPTPTPCPYCPTHTATPTATCNPEGMPRPWMVVNPLSSAAYEPGVGSDGTYAYVAGGVIATSTPGAATTTNAFARYQPGSNTWTNLPSMSDGAAGASVVYSPINNKVYVFGGAGSNNIVSSRTRIYDLASGTWSD